MNRLYFIISTLLILGAVSIFPTDTLAHPGHVHETEASEMESDDSSMQMKEDTSETNANDSEVETISDTKVDSFELFWPITAGKTRGERFYFLKLFKEKARGALIFGDAKDADYHLFLATKRVVEAEKLIGENKLDEARETLEDAREHVDEATEEWSDVENTDTPVKHEINNKLNNLNVFLPYLVTLTEDITIADTVNSINEKVISLNSAV